MRLDLGAKHKGPASECLADLFAKGEIVGLRCD